MTDLEATRSQQIQKQIEVMKGWNLKSGKDSNVAIRPHNSFKDWEQDTPSWDWMNCSYKLLEEKSEVLSREEFLVLIGEKFQEMPSTQSEIVGYTIKQGHPMMILKRPTTGWLHQISLASCAGLKFRTVSGKKLYKSYWA